MSKVKSAILPYLNESLDVDSRVKDLLERLTLEEKFQIISGHMLWWTNANKRLKIQRWVCRMVPVGFHFIPVIVKIRNFLLQL